MIDETIFCVKFGPNSVQKLLKLMAMDWMFVIFLLTTAIVLGKTSQLSCPIPNVSFIISHVFLMLVLYVLIKLKK